MSDQGGGNRNGQRPQGRRGRPWFRPRPGSPGQEPAGSREGAEGRGESAGRQNAPGGGTEEGFETIVRTPPPACPICGKPVSDILSAITERASSSPAHFDCVLSSLAEAEKPQANERLVYLGAGVFAVVEADQRNPQKFQVKRKIQYEAKEARPDWRKSLDRIVIRRK
jgi:hypothetical protein